MRSIWSSLIVRGVRKTYINIMIITRTWTYVYINVTVMCNCSSVTYSSKMWKISIVKWDIYLRLEVIDGYREDRPFVIAVNNFFFICCFFFLPIPHTSGLFTKRFPGFVFNFFSLVFVCILSVRWLGVCNVAEKHALSESLQRT